MAESIAGESDHIRGHYIHFYDIPVCCPACEFFSVGLAYDSTASVYCGICGTKWFSVGCDGHGEEQ
jgi:hypothetical protein